jgi:hypothetical protein
MRTIAVTIGALAIVSAALLAQEAKKVPKDSVRVSIPGCTKGYVFTAGRRTADQPGTVDVAEGMHLRMNGPKKLISDIKAHEGSMIEITGIVRKDDLAPAGINIGGGVRMKPGAPPGSSSLPSTPISGQASIDVEGWRPATGSCPGR